MLREVAAGNPVLVLQNLGVASVPLWHYAVVVGFDSSRDALILRSGEEARKRVSARHFAYSWSLARNWAVVVVRPRRSQSPRLPMRSLRRQRDSKLPNEARRPLTAYGAARERWPEEVTPLLGIGNISYAAHRLPEAEDAYRATLELNRT